MYRKFCPILQFRVVRTHDVSSGNVHAGGISWYRKFRYPSSVCVSAGFCSWASQRLQYDEDFDELYCTLVPDSASSRSSSAILRSPMQTSPTYNSYFPPYACVLPSVTAYIHTCIHTEMTLLHDYIVVSLPARQLCDRVMYAQKY